MVALLCQVKVGKDTPFTASEGGLVLQCFLDSPSEPVPHGVRSLLSVWWHLGCRVGDRRKAQLPPVKTCFEGSHLGARGSFARCTPL